MDVLEKSGGKFQTTVCFNQLKATLLEGSEDATIKARVHRRLSNGEAMRMSVRPNRDHLQFDLSDVLNARISQWEYWSNLNDNLHEKAKHTEDSAINFQMDPARRRDRRLEGAAFDRAGDLGDL